MAEGSGFDRLRVGCRAVRRRAALTLAASALSLIGLVVLLLSVLPAAAREGRGSLVPLGLALLLWTGVAMAAWWTRRTWRGLRPDVVAEEVDGGAGLGAGDVRAALELARPRGSPGARLAAYHRARVSDALSRLGPAGLLPRTAPRWNHRARRSAWMAGITWLTIVAAAWARPQPTRSAVVALGAPWRTAFPPPLPALQVHGPDGVRRGQPATIEVSAVGRERVTLAWRAAGQVIERRELRVSAGGAAEGRTGPIESAMRIWAEDEAGVSSDTLLIRPGEPLLVQDLQVVVEYPAYLDRGAETHRGRIPPLVAPEGTRIRVSGETNVPLDTGALSWRAEGRESAAGEGRRVALDISGTRFGATWVPRRTGTWVWDITAAASVGEPITPGPIRVLVVPDLAPRIQLLYPAPDTTLGFERVMPLVVDVEDDIGLRQAYVRSWRSGLGEDRAERREVLSPGPAGAQRSVFRHLLDRSAEPFLPGDTLYYQIEAFDGHPSRGPTLSDVFVLRVPTFREIRDQRADGTEALSEAAVALEDAMQALSEAAADAARLTDAAGDDSEEARFEATEEARSVLDDAERAGEQLDSVEEDLQALRDELEASSLSDPALEDQLRRLAERYQELAEQGLAERIEALAEALRDLDPEAVRAALERLAQDSEALREQLDQTLGVIEQAALEQAMQSAQANADELAGAQRDLTRETDAATFEQEQQSVAERAEDLAQRLDELEERLDAAGRQVAADSAAAAGERTEEALDRMSAAQSGAGDPSPGERGDVSQSQKAAAEEAADALEQAASALGSAQENLNGESGESAPQTLGRARSEALSLADEEGRLADATRGEDTAEPEAWRARQGAVRQGLENLLERLSDSGNEAAMLDQRTGAAAGQAAEQMDRLLERLAEDGARRLPSRAEAESIQESLNDLAQYLLANEQAARAAEQQSAGQDAAQQMSQLAQEQQAVTQETSSLLVPGPKPAGRERRREQLARRQEEIAEELGQLDDPERDLLGRPEELAEEAADLAHQLELQGPTQETLQRQRQLFQRMLDAGRSLDDDDLDPEQRESEAATVGPRAPPEIHPDLLRGRRFPLPSEAVLRGLPIFYRALIFDYFDRLNRAPPGARDAAHRDP